MFIWFKKKEVVLDCFTHHWYAYDQFKIDKAVKFIPEWFKNLGPGTFDDPRLPLLPTMKRCTGFIDYFKNSIAVPMWDFLHFRMYENNGFDPICNSAQITSHPNAQYNGFLDESYLHVKIKVPWVISSTSKVQFLQTFPIWCYPNTKNIEKFLHCPGVVDFKYQTATNVNGFLKRPGHNESAWNLSFEPGVPFSFFTPLDDVKINIKHHLVSYPEFSQRMDRISMTPGNRRLIINKRAIDKQEVSRCPFHKK